MLEQQDRAYDFLKKNGFRPVSREDYALFKTYDETDSMVWETTAIASVTWGFSINSLYKTIRDYLCSVWFQSGAVYMIVQRPAGIPEASLQEIVNILYTLSSGAGFPALQIYGIEGRFLNDYRALEGYTVTSEYSDDFSEYIYRIDDFLELSGSANQEKRRRLKKCSKITNLSTCPITDENIRMCLKVEEEWCLKQDCPSCRSFSGCEKIALENMCDIFDEHIHIGIFSYINNEVVGFIIGEKLNKHLAVLYYAKANISDLNAYLYYILVKKYFSDVTYLNIAHDMGKTGLRYFKSHLGAYEYLRKYICTFTKAEGKHEQE
jgi:hypothetical protein